MSEEPVEAKIERQSQDQKVLKLLVTNNWKSEPRELQLFYIYAVFILSLEPSATCIFWDLVRFAWFDTREILIVIHILFF